MIIPGPRFCRTIINKGFRRNLCVFSEKVGILQKLIDKQYPKSTPGPRQNWGAEQAIPGPRLSCVLGGGGCGGWLAWLHLSSLCYASPSQVFLLLGPSIQRQRTFLSNYQRHCPRESLSFLDPKRDKDMAEMERSVFGPFWRGSFSGPFRVLFGVFVM